MKPPSCSLVSMNGPSVTWRSPPPTRTVVAVCELSRPSQAISTPAARAASSNACHAAISRAPSSGEKSSAPRSSPYSVKSTFTLHLRRFRSSRGRTGRAISTAATRQPYSWRAIPRSARSALTAADSGGLQRGRLGLLLRPRASEVGRDVRDRGRQRRGEHEADRAEQGAAGDRDDEDRERVD